MEGPWGLGADGAVEAAPGVGWRSIPQGVEKKILLFYNIYISLQSLTKTCVAVCVVVQVYVAQCDGCLRETV